MKKDEESQNVINNNVCVIADPRSGSQCPSHHNCNKCEYLKKVKKEK